MTKEKTRKNNKRESFCDDDDEKDYKNMKPKIKELGYKHSHTDAVHHKHSKLDYYKEKTQSKHKEKPYDKPHKNSCHESNLNKKDSDPKDKSSKKSHKHSRKRTREEEESYEELSNRKKRIELELQQLDMEEAEEAQRKRPNKDHSNHYHHHRHQDRNSDSDVNSIRIKEEPLSDNEISRRRNRNDRHRHRPNNDGGRHVHELNSRVKEEPQDRSPHSNRRNHQGHRSNSEQDMQWGRPEHSKSEKKNVKDKEKPNFETSGKLAEDTNTYNGVVIKYNEPNEARKPRRRWRLYPFKGNETLPFIPIHRQSAYLLGRSRLIADIPIDHPSCSKQHAVLQYRLTPYTKEDGTKGRSIRPYVIDLDSSNGTFVNNKRIDPRRYMELFEKDVLKFGFSSRVYVILHEESKTEDINDEDELASLSSEEEEDKKD